LLLFEVLICCVSLLFSVAGSIAPQIVLTIPSGGLSFGSNTALLLAASLLPGLALVLTHEECRAAIFRFGASVRVYLLALAIGLTLPFTGYIGARHSYPIWDTSTVGTLVRVFFINLLLSPLWEEVIWRGYFYPKVVSTFPLPRAILLGTLGWTIWHVGFLFYLHKSGVPTAVLPVFVAQIFLIGIVQCSVFTLGNNSLAPCVLLHTAFNASTLVYYGNYDRIGDIGSYISEATAMLLVAGVLVGIVMRKIRLRSDPRFVAEV